MSVGTYKEALLTIVATIQRKRSTFAITKADPTAKTQFGHEVPFALTAGSDKVVKVAGGFVVSMSISREQLQKLRDTCDELLQTDA